MKRIATGRCRKSFCSRADRARARYGTGFASLLDAGQFNLAYTLDAARYRAIVRNSDNSIQYEYDGDGGDTIRFGDGSFGEPPEDGDQFQAIYRVGGGAAGNVAADSITQISPSAAVGPDRGNQSASRQRRRRSRIARDGTASCSASISRATVPRRYSCRLPGRS